MAVGEAKWSDLRLGKILVFDDYGGNGSRSIQYADAVEDLAYSPDGTLLAVATLDAYIDVIHVRKPDDRKRLIGHEPISDNVFSSNDNDVIGVSFSPDGKLLASIGEDKNVILWHTRDWSIGAVITLSWHDRMARSGPLVSWSKDSKYLAVPWEGSQVRVFTVRVID